jgi:[amino group carrier protein]-lysine/ornithine hydrolase
MSLSIPETLYSLVRYYSPSGMERPAVEWLVGRMQALGFTQAYIDPVGNAIGIMGHGPRQGVLLGHIDTHPGEIPLRAHGGHFHGRGVVDAKGALAAMVDAVARLGAPPGWQMVVIAAVDEERDSTGAWYVVGQYHPEFAIIGEPSRWDRITLGYKGIAWAEVRVSRPLAHTASQEQSAPEAAFRIWGWMQDWAGRFNADRPRVFDQVLPSLREFTSGDDGLEGWASLKIDTRLPVDLSPQDWYALLRQNFSTGEHERIWINQSRWPIPAFLGDKNNGLVRALLAAIRQAGGKPGFVLKTGTADLNIVAPAWGCPAVAYGPGDSNLDHTPREQLSLVEYERAVAVLAESLRQICATPDEPI